MNLISGAEFWFYFFLIAQFSLTYESVGTADFIMNFYPIVLLNIL